MVEENCTVQVKVKDKSFELSDSMRNEYYIQNEGIDEVTMTFRTGNNDDLSLLWLRKLRENLRGMTHEFTDQL